jgi:hypothetical protein
LIKLDKRHRGIKGTSKDRHIARVRVWGAGVDIYKRGESTNNKNKGKKQKVNKTRGNC